MSNIPEKPQPAVSMDVDFSGYLEKQSKKYNHQGEWLKQWRKRYFYLKGSKLYFAVDKFVFI